MKSKNLYRIGLAMIIYFMLGHLTCLIARLTGNIGAYIWNTYSKYVFPPIHPEIAYDAYWSVYGIVALILIIQYKTNNNEQRKQTNDKANSRNRYLPNID